MVAYLALAVRVWDGNNVLLIQERAHVAAIVTSSTITNSLRTGSAIWYA